MNQMSLSSKPSRKRPRCGNNNDNEDETAPSEEPLIETNEMLLALFQKYKDDTLIVCSVCEGGDNEAFDNLKDALLVLIIAKRLQQQERQFCHANRIAHS